MFDMPLHIYSEYIHKVDPFYNILGITFYLHKLKTGYLKWNSFYVVKLASTKDKR